MKRICVFAGSSSGARPQYRLVAEELGRAIAVRRLTLVYGGGRVGLMGAVADAALHAGGDVIGVIPESLAAKEVAHQGLPDLRIVASMHERKALMAELSDGFVALPGGWGTMEEFFEVLTWAQLGLHQKPCGLLNVSGYFDRLLSFLEHSIDQRFVKDENRSMVLVATAPDTLLGMCERHVPSAVEKWIDEAST
jgi:uncharacterized protein (TIGR00730 family)